MTPEEFRIAGHALIDWISDYRQRIDQLPVRSAVNPGDVRRAISSVAPEFPESFDDVMADPGVCRT